MKDQGSLIECSRKIWQLELYSKGHAEARQPELTRGLLIGVFVRHQIRKQAQNRLSKNNL